MIPKQLEREFLEFMEFPDTENKKTVTSTSAMLFANHWAEKMVTSRLNRLHKHTQCGNLKLTRKEYNELYQCVFEGVDTCKEKGK